MSTFHARVLIGYSLLVSFMVLYLSTALLREKAAARILIEAQNIDAGDSLQSFTAVDLYGQSVSVDYGTRPWTVISFLSSDCIYCEQTMPQLQELNKSLALRVVAVAVDDLQSYRRRGYSHVFDYPLVEFPDRAVAGMFRVHTVPLTVAVDRKGKVLLSIKGQIEPDGLRRLASLQEP